MSHAKERKDKNCLNCNAIVAGRFCQVCGQENIETHETFSHLAGHLVSDIFHFDGVFFSTSKYLLFKPGFLTHEYVRGRRTSYLNPIKMYVFISAIFFLYFLTVYQPALKVSIKNEEEKSAAFMLRELRKDSADMASSLRDNTTPFWVKNRITASLPKLNNDISLLEKDSTKKFQVLANMQSTSILSTNDYTSESEYDSIQKTLPANLKDNWIKQKLEHKNIDIGNKFRRDKGEMTNTLIESFLHHFHKLYLFIFRFLHSFYSYYMRGINSFIMPITSFIPFICTVQYSFFFLSCYC